MPPRATAIGGLVAAAGLVGGGWALLHRFSLEVDGASMRPTLSQGDVVLTAPLGRPPDRGELVVVRDPREPDRRMVKRVVGRAGDRPDLLPVPEGHVFVVGDDRGASTDSRTFGAVPYGRVEARVLARLRRAQSGRRATTSSSGSSRRTSSAS